jgi:8-oxo-dGTP diphosphatase
MRDPVAIVAAVVSDAAGRLLLVRKEGTMAFMQPGGKREAGEGDLVALERELGEELGCGIVAGSTVALGRFHAPAANETGRDVVADLWAVVLSGTPRPCAEIVEIRWVDPAAPGDVPLAPLTRDHVLPLMRGRAA